MIVRFLVTLFLFYLAFRFLFRLLGMSSPGPQVFTFGTKKTPHQPEEGEVTVHTTTGSKQKNRPTGEGEYVDYEEIN
jgi:hypothetical protein